MSGAPSADNGFLAAHAALLYESFATLLKRPLLVPDAAAPTAAEALFRAPFAVLSSGLESDPLFNYANATALGLFELDWATLVALPARESAEAVNQAARAKLMSQVAADGFIENYSGVRISASGRRFTIEDAIVWNVIDRQGELHGQAATFAAWRYL